VQERKKSVGDKKTFSKKKLMAVGRETGPQQGNQKKMGGGVFWLGGLGGEGGGWGIGGVRRYGRTRLEVLS